MKCQACTIKPPDWYRGRESSGSQLGCIGKGALAQCNGIFTSDAVTLTIGTTVTGTLTFTTSTANFTKFYPVGIVFDVVEADGSSIDEAANKVTGITSVNYQGIDYRLDGNSAPMSLFGPYSEVALSAIELGEITNGGPNVTIGIASILTGGTNAYVHTATMYGFSIRGGGGTAGGGSSAVVP